MRLINADSVQIPFMADPQDEKWMRIAIDAAPTIDAIPVRKGAWKDTDVFEVKSCSECGETYRMPFNFDAEVFPYNYCPNCGAAMR